MFPSSFYSIILGVVTLPFFQCIGRLLDSSNCTRGGIKWGLIAYTAAMFSFVMIFTAMNLNHQSVSYIDNREFPGVRGELVPGPLGY